MSLTPPLSNSRLHKKRNLSLPSLQGLPTFKAFQFFNFLYTLRLQHIFMCKTRWTFILLHSPLMSKVLLTIKTVKHSLQLFFVWLGSCCYKTQVLILKFWTHPNNPKTHLINITNPKLHLPGLPLVTNLSLLSIYVLFFVFFSQTYLSLWYTICNVYNLPVLLKTHLISYIFIQNRIFL